MAKSANKKPKFKKKLSALFFLKLNFAFAVRNLDRKKIKNEASRANLKIQKKTWPIYAY